MHDINKEKSTLVRVSKKVSTLSLSETNKLIQELGRSTTPEQLRSLKGIVEGAIALAEQIEEERIAQELEAKQKMENEIAAIADLLRSFPHGQKLSDKQLSDAAASMYNESLKASAKPKRKSKVKSVNVDQTVNQEKTTGYEAAEEPIVTEGNSNTVNTVNNDIQNSY